MEASGYYGQPTAIGRDACKQGCLTTPSLSLSLSSDRRLKTLSTFNTQASS